MEGKLSERPTMTDDILSGRLTMTDDSLGDRLTIILVTSPILSHPSTEMIEKVVDSFSLISQLSHCRLLLIADGVKTGKFRPKKGQVPPAMLTTYHQYLDNLQHLVDTTDTDSIWSRTMICRLPDHIGFGHAVLHGLNTADTEYVMVVQHDHPFTRRFSITPVIDFMDNMSANYVCLPISTVFRHINRCSSLHQIDLRSKSVSVEDSKFVPILFWYDGTHVARRSAYIRLVFKGDEPVPVGHFIEDTFSQRAMALLRSDLECWLPVFSMWVFLPEGTKETALICHLDGRNYRTDLEREQLGWGTNPEIDLDRNIGCKLSVVK